MTRLSRILGVWFTYYVPVLINFMTPSKHLSIAYQGINLRRLLRFLFLSKAPHVSTTVGKSFDANSVYIIPTDLPLLFPFLNIFFGMLLISYPCIKLVEYHHPGFCFGMVFRSKRFVTSILVIDVTGKSHSFTFAPHGMVFDLKSHINSKFNITSDLYWL